MADNTEGLISLQSGMVPNNLNERAWVTDNTYVKGAPQTFDSLDVLIAFHPFKMGKGMSATVINHPEIGVVSGFRLIGDPANMVDGSKETIVTIDNYTAYWELVDEVRSTVAVAYMYAPDTPQGGAPVYPYTVASESAAGWEPTFDANKGHRWLRFRADAIDTNEDGVYDNWTQPIRVTDSYTSGDYVENRFKRQAVDIVAKILSGATATGLTPGLYYSVNVGTVDKTKAGTTVRIGIGYNFLYETGAGISYVFNTATLYEVVQNPPRTISGLPNNEPAGWQDTIPSAPVGEQLWQIWAQKSVYGQLKSDWRIKKVNEDVDLIRYNNNVNTHPDTFGLSTTTIIKDDVNDLALIAAGWVTDYDSNTFLAQRTKLTEAPTYTAWSVQKIEEESGEYTDNVFKLFDLNLDSDDVAIAPPTTRDPASENDGWADGPHIEPLDGTSINYISSARKFFDGTLKTSWSSPVAYTGQDAWTDTISSDTGDDFKYNNTGAVIPAQIVLTSKLFKGTAKMWLNNTITYVWEIVFNNGGSGLPAGTEAGLVGGQPLFYYNPASSGTIGTDDYIQIGQTATILPNAVDGKAIIRCTQNIEISAGNTLEFVEEFSILDITDGNDAKALTLNTDTYVIVYDSTATALTPSTGSLRAYSANLINTTWKWWIDVGNIGTWVEISSRNGYSINGTILNFDNTATGVSGWGINADWSQDGVQQENRFAITNYDGNPDSPSLVAADEEFRDIVTISKLSSAGVGTDGVTPVYIALGNENHTVVLNNTTGSPQTNQIGLGNPAQTKVQFYDGLTPRVYVPTGPTADQWTITALNVTALDQNGTAVNADVEADKSDGTVGDTEATVFIDQWSSTNFPTYATISAQVEIVISYNSNTYSKVFTLGATLDAPGAIVLDIDSNKGFIFDVSDRGDKILTANVIDDSGNVTAADFYFRWFVEGVWEGTWGTLGIATKTLTHANIRGSADVKVAISTNPASDPDTQAYRTRAVRFSDIQDGKQFIFYNNDIGSTPTKPTGNGRTTSPLQDIGAIDDWYRSDDVFWASNTPVWASDGSESSTDGTWAWGVPYKIVGEAGAQGPNGGFEMSLYILGGTTSPIVALNTYSIGAHLNLAEPWSAQVPTPSFEDTVWVIKRFYQGKIGNDEVAFQSNAVPIWGATEDTGNVSTKALGGSVWSTPQKLIIVPSEPIVPDNGNNGWSPNLRLVTRNAFSGNPETLVIQRTNWIGGTGSDPGGYGQYMGSSGFVTDIRNATPVKGLDGDDGIDANTHVLKTYMLDGSYRSIFRIQTVNSYYYRTFLLGETAPKAAGTTTYWKLEIAFQRTTDVQVTVEAWLSSATSVTTNSVLSGKNILSVDEYGRYSSPNARYGMVGFMETTTDDVKALVVRVKGNVTASTIGTEGFQLTCYDKDSGTKMKMISQS